MVELPHRMRQISSPPLFNVYHQAVMEDFRLRRQEQARNLGLEPGVPWTVKVDGRVDHHAHSREHLFRRSTNTTIGDVGFADDTCILGVADEVIPAERLLETTMLDWCEKVHPGKTEGLRVSTTPRAPFDVRYKGEKPVVRHVGGMLQETGGQQADTSHRRSKGFFRIRQTARAWHFGTRSQQSKMPHSIRVKIMKAVLMPTLTCFGRSRSWNRDSIRSMQQVVDWAVQRCLNVRKHWKRAHHVSSEMLNEIAQWEPFHYTIARQSLFWLGHLARMDTGRLPKQAAFGFWKGHTIRERPIMRQGQWFKHILAQIQVSHLDWFRLAQDRVAWKRAVVAEFPTGSPSRNKIRRLNEFRLADGSPGIHEFSYRREKRKRERNMVTDPVTGMYHCPLCPARFDKANSLWYHYEDKHAVADPTILTVQMYSCDDCGQTWRVEKRRREHVCPAAPRIRGPPRVHPLGNCRLCGEQMIVPNLERHEAVCRGPGNANLTCIRCGKVLGSVQARKNHEARNNCV